MKHDPTNDPVAWMAQQLASDPNLDPVLVRHFASAPYRPLIDCNVCNGSAYGRLFSTCMKCGGSGEMDWEADGDDE